MRDPRRTPRWQHMRLAMYRRDKAAGARCWVCGEPIDYSAAPSSTPDSYEPDHVKPVAKYPQLAFDPTNIRACHTKCNRSRGAKAYLNALGTQSRDWWK